ncbi:mucoidy inhibitor MuiA family protein [uncultured Microscilla sp.]|uniref:mucoidy inhibitor MuiA family protein n=1 Tax=uncultured Microscilla sp. TaxID=432653 RepID=UPI002624FF45|nr:mucoidy inhibitor MuiA family protein [uncultured Microscilla sp.]
MENTTNQMIESKVVAVTVFQDRAEVSREARLDLPVGNHTLVFDQLPDSIEEKSVQVSGKGVQATLTQVKFLTEYYDQTPDEEVKALEDKKQGLMDEGRKLQNEQQRLQGQQRFLQGMVNRITKPSKGQRKSKPQDWLKMLDYYGQKQAKVDEALLKVKQQVRQNTEALSKLEKEVMVFFTQPQKARKQVEVQISVVEEGALQLLLSYVVQGASWEPYYDLRVSTETEEMDLVYKAMIRQNTEESWSNAALRLSTARPHIGGRQPELKAWRIQQHNPITAQQVRERLKTTMKEISGGAVKAMKKVKRPAVGSMPKPAKDVEEKERGIMIAGAVYDESNIDQFLERDEKRKVEEAQKIVDNKPQSPPVMDRGGAKIESGGTAVFFEIEGVHTVKNDDTEHQVTILQDTFSAHLQYSAVPKLSAHTYLRARTTNHTDYPLLAGSTHIFLDNNFVANASMDTIAPSEEFWTFLGTDEGVKVVRKFLKKYAKKEGSLFGKKHKNLVYEYLIEAKNFKPRAIELIVKDQLPASQNDEVKVELLKPVYSEDSDELKIDKFKTMEWLYTLDPGKELQIPFEFAITHPADVWLKES